MNPLHWRLMTWVLWGWTGLMGVGGIALAAVAVASAECDDLDQTTCDAAAGVAGAFWLGASFCVWLLGFVVLGIVWLTTRPVRRVCPACGHEARQGQRVCRKCGFDFARSASPIAAP